MVPDITEVPPPIEIGHVMTSPITWLTYYWGAPAYIAPTPQCPPIGGYLLRGGPNPYRYLGYIARASALPRLGDILPRHYGSRGVRGRYLPDLPFFFLVKMTSRRALDTQSVRYHPMANSSFELT